MSSRGCRRGPGLPAGPVEARQGHRQAQARRRRLRRPPLPVRRRRRPPPADQGALFRVAGAVDVVERAAPDHSRTKGRPDAVAAREDRRGVHPIHLRVDGRSQGRHGGSREFVAQRERDHYPVRRRSRPSRRRLGRALDGGQLAPSVPRLRTGIRPRRALVPRRPRRLHESAHVHREADLVARCRVAVPGPASRRPGLRLQTTCQKGPRHVGGVRVVGSPLDRLVHDRGGASSRGDLRGVVRGPGALRLPRGHHNTCVWPCGVCGGSGRHGGQPTRCRDVAAAAARCRGEFARHVPRDDQDRRPGHTSPCGRR
mmetsp:Transcript_16554/g.50104  ORF Transcript_16554/g.50104 Transcript_16554/m.50104 type:complete len:313 (-) Transcript_16554:2408-3346(-)